MKKKIAYILVAALIIIAGIGLGVSAFNNMNSEKPNTEVQGDGNEDDISDEDLMKKAVAYVKTIYKDVAKETPNDFERIGTVPVGKVKFNVEWSVDVDESIIKIVKQENGLVLIDINEEVGDETPYVLTATITDGKGNSKTLTWEHVIPAKITGSYQEIVDMAYALKNGESLPNVATLQGTVTNINTPWDSGYKNITVTIVVEGREDKPIQCYRLKSGAADASTIEKGDLITVTGTLKNYNGTIEFDAGCTLDAIEKGAGTIQKVTGTMQEIVDKAYALKAGESLKGEATLTGTVTAINSSWSDQYKNISVTIVVEGREDKPIQCYRLKSGAADASKIAKGDLITVTGTLKNYNGTIEFDAGCTLDANKKGAGTIDTVEGSMQEIVDKAYALEDGAVMKGEATLTGTVTAINSAWSDDFKNITVTIVVEGRETKPIQCYRMKSGAADASKVAKGDLITVTGILKNYNGTIEFDAGCTLDANKKGAGSIDTVTGTMQEIVDKAYALEAGATLKGEATLTGSVTKVNTPYDDNYKNVTVTIVIDGREDKPIMCYRMKGTNAEKVAAGDLITVVGTLKNYNGTIEFDAGCELTKWVQGGGTYVPEEPDTPDVPVVPDTPVLPEVTLKDGDKVVIIAPAYNKALSATKTGNYNVGVDVTIKDGVVSGYDEASTWTVIVNADGTYSFANGGQNIGMADQYTSMNLGAVNDKWEVIALGDGLYNIKNVGRETYMEWYAKYSNWSTYGASNAATDDQFQLAFYVISGGSDTPDVPDVPDATVADAIAALQEKMAEKSFADEGVYELVDSIVVNGVTYNVTWESTNILVASIAGNNLTVVPDTNEDKQFSLTATVTNAALDTDADTVEFGPYDVPKVEEVVIEIPLEDGDQIVIYAPAYNKALSATKTGNYNVGVDVTITDDVMTGYDEASTWTVIVNADGTYSFANGGQNIGMADQYTSMNLGAVNDTWEVIALGDDLYNLKNVGRGTYMEWYAKYSNWSTYAASNAATDDQFQLAFYVIPGGSDAPDVPEVPTVTVTDALAALTEQMADKDYAAPGTYTLPATVTVEEVEYNVVWSVTTGNEVASVVDDTLTVVASTTDDVEFTLVATVTNATDANDTATADWAYTVVKEEVVETAPFEDGDQVVIYAPAYNKALSATKTGNYNVGVDVTITDGVMTGYDEASTWTVIVNADGTYSFANGGQNIGLADQYTSMNLGAVNDTWEVIALGDGLYNLKNVGRETYMEWYSKYSNWSTYGASNAATDDQFQLAFYVISGESDTPDVPEVPTVTVKEAVAALAEEMADKDYTASGTYALPTVVTVDGSVYNVTWSVTSGIEVAAIVESTLTVVASTTDDVEFTLVATVTNPTDANDTATADWAYTVVKEEVVATVPFEDGDQVVIYAPAYNKALSATKTGNYNVGVDVTITDGVMTGYDETSTWTVIANADGTYSFANGGQNIGMADSYTSMNLGAVNDKWEVIALGDGLYNLKNVGRETYMEWYSKYSNWSTYGASNAATDDQFQLAFYVVPATEEKQEVFVKVTEDQEDWSGTYLIVYEDGGMVFDGSLTTLDAANNNQTFDIADGKIEATEATKAVVFTIEKSGDAYTIKSESGYYIGHTSDANKLSASTNTQYTNTITMNEDGSVNVICSGGAYLRFNANVDQMRFRYYKSGTYTKQKATTLYKLVEE